MDSKSPDGTARRWRLPTKRKTVRVKAKLRGLRVYVDCGLYPNGRPGEIAVTVAKSGSVLRGMLDSWSLAVSLALQHGCSVKQLVHTFRRLDFEPSGTVTEHDSIVSCASIVDYVMQVLELDFPEKKEKS